MRIISGTARGRKLAEFKGKNIRPTPDRVREAVFSSLLSRFGSFEEIKVLDLFAGSGAMTIEALSRGAGKGILVDSSSDAEKLIQQNLSSTGLADKADFKKCDVLKALPNLSQRGPFDLIFMDPPYADSTFEQILDDLIHFGLLQTDGIICVETSSRTDTPDNVGVLHCTDRRIYGSTKISFYSYSSPETA